MGNLKLANSELRRAHSSFEAMKLANDFIAFEDNWKDILNHLEKCWTKAELECREIKDKFQPWQGKYVELRKKDPLLKYLKQARNSDMHSVQEIVGKAPNRFIIRSTGASTVSKIALSLNLKSPTELVGEIEFESYGDPLNIKFVREGVETKTIVNQGVYYVPPQFHRGKPLKNHNDPIEIAELGIKFYEEYLKAIKSSFF